MDEVLYTKDCLREKCEGTVRVYKRTAPSLLAIQEAKRFCSPRCAQLHARAEKWKDPEHKAMMVAKLTKAANRPAARKRQAASISGSKAPWWKDDAATYNSKHRWIQRHWKRIGKCEHCGKRPPPRKNGYSGTEWSNISGDYNRNDRNDWQELCSKCHKFFDKAQRLVKSKMVY